MSRAAFIAALATAAVPLLTGRASADIMQYESLDLAVRSSDLVIRGEVVEIVSKKGDNGVVWNRLTVKVKEKIRGEKLKEVSFLVPESSYADRGATWRNLRDEMLFCLNALKSTEGPFRVDYSLRHGQFFWAVPLTTGVRGVNGPVYSLDFTALTDPKEILAAARAEAEAPTGKARSQLEWIVQGPGILMPHAVLYPDSGRVRAAAKSRKIDLLPK